MYYNNYIYIATGISKGFRKNNLKGSYFLS